LTGGPITGSGALSIATAGVTNAMLANPSLTVAAGTDLTGGGIVALAGTTTLNLDTTKVPQLNAANAFTGNQTVNGNLSATGVVAGNSYQIGSNLFAFGSYSNQNAFLGFAGNTTMTGSYNTANGFDALYYNTTGHLNAAFGLNALLINTTGSANSAFGESAGSTADASFITGTNDTFLGNFSALGTGTLNNATAIGASAEVDASNSLVLGGINGVNGSSADTNVGIGTTTPSTTLDVKGNSTYHPLLVESANTFGTWMNLSNTSAGGASWAILSAASGNSEGAGNLAFTNFNSNATVFIHANLHVDGNISKGSGSFQIDHPLDPADKYLYHSFVESPDMMNIYDSVVTLNAQASAWITLPDYFEALNRDFRYQLTSLGRPQPSLYIAREVRVTGSRSRVVNRAEGFPGR
jgi:hypothetical protein